MQPELDPETGLLQIGKPAWAEISTPKSRKAASAGTSHLSGITRAIDSAALFAYGITRRKREGKVSCGHVHHPSSRTILPLTTHNPNIA